MHFWSDNDRVDSVTLLRILFFVFCLFVCLFGRFVFIGFGKRRRSIAFTMQTFFTNFIFYLCIIRHTHSHIHPCAQSHTRKLFVYIETLPRLECEICIRLSRGGGGVDDDMTSTNKQSDANWME